MNITELIDISLIETRELLQELPPEKTYKEIEELIRNTIIPDKTKLYSYSNYEIFLTILDYTNYDTVNRHTTIEFLEEVKDTINNWNTDNIKDLESIFEPEIDETKIIEAIYNLGLNSNFTIYELRLAFKFISNFIKFKNKVQELSSGIRIDPKTLKRAFNYTILGDFARLLEKDLSDLNYETRKEQINGRIKYTLEVQKYHQDNKLQELNTIPPEWHHYLNPSLLEEIYHIVFKNQKKEYNQVLNINTKLKEEYNKTPLINYLYINKINPKDIPRISILNNIEFNFLLKKISFFQQLNYQLIDILINLVDYLLELDEDTINFYNYLINKNILKKETIINNLKILKDRLIVKTNYDILKTIIDFNNPYYKDTILLSDPHNLKDKISILKEYKISINNLIFLLCNFKYMNIYDLVIENNIPEYLLIPICNSSNPLLTIKKILISREINEPYETPNHILKKEITQSNNFLCPDNQIDNYLDKNYISDLPYLGINDITENKEVKELDEYYRIDNFYIFNNTKISRPKVLKHLQYFKTKNNRVKEYIYLSIISNSLLSNIDLDNINKCLNNNITL